MKAKSIKLQKYYNLPKVDPSVAVTPRTTYDIFYQGFVGLPTMKLLTSTFPMDNDKFNELCEQWKKEMINAFGFKPVYYFSSVAKANRIPNRPTVDYIQYNLLSSNRLLCCILAVFCAVRNISGNTVRCTSAYRCERVNKIVGGAPFSLHRHGLAYDLVFSSSADADAFVTYIIEYVKSDGLVYDDKPTLLPYEIIRYSGTNRVHIGFKYMVVREFSNPK